MRKALSRISESDGDYLARHIISGDLKILEALEALNRLSGDTMTLFVADEEGRIQGSLTDGDVRRSLISGKTLDDKVSAICKREFRKIDHKNRDVREISEAKEAGIALLPIIEDGYLVSLFDLRKMRGWLPACAVLMAGGVGERLRPLTLQTPKPLLAVGGRPIIDHNLQLLREYGVKDIYVTVNYLKDKIITHLKEDWPGVRYVEEPSKLGTIGSLSLIDDIPENDIIVMNSDLLTDINLEAMWLKHNESKADITVAVTPYTVSIPFAIMEHSGDRVEGIIEKPTYNYYANAGIYMLRKEIKERIEKGKYLDAPELIDRVLESGGRVSQYVVRERWLDIGSPDDYRHACELMKG